MLKPPCKTACSSGRTIGVAAYTTQQALQWGVTGAGLRATGLNFDLRKWRPYSGYEQFDFDVPVGANGDAYDRAMVRSRGDPPEPAHHRAVHEEHALRGPFKADHPLTTPPPKERTLQDIETLITHFLQVSWGPVMPAAESLQMIEATKGINSYYLTSDGSTMSYRTRIRTPELCPSAADPFGDPRQHGLRSYRLSGEYRFCYVRCGSLIMTHQCQCQSGAMSSTVSQAEPMDPLN
jgi:NADH-quinone oxidoreductase subunit C/D